MTKKPLISFVLISYKQERFIREAVKGAFAQTYSPLEIIISDDCSPDRTFDIIQEMTAAYKGLHNIILNCNEKNLGLCGNLNRAVALTSGELIVLAAGDDISVHSRVETIFNTWSKSGKGMVSIFSNCSLIDESGNAFVERSFKTNSLNNRQIDLISHDNKARLTIFPLNHIPDCLNNWVLGATHAFHRKVFDTFGPLPTSLIQEDVALAWRSTMLGGILYIDKPLVCYRRHDENQYPDKQEMKASTLKQQRHRIVLNISRIVDIKTAKNRGLVTADQCRSIKTALSWEIQCGKIKVLYGDDHILQALVAGLQSLVFGVKRKNMLGWLLWIFMPRVHNLIQKSRSLQNMLNPKLFFTKITHCARPEVCMNVAAWAMKRRLPVIELYPPVIGEVQPHIIGDAMAQEEFTKHRLVLERPQSLVAIEDAFIRDAVGFVELPTGQICYEGNWWLPYLQEHPAYRRCVFFKHRLLKGNCYSLLCLWSSLYYHWFHDVLPRLENALPHLPGDTRFLINEKPSAYQLKSLEAYGIGVERLELQPPGVRTRLERLWFATPVGHSSLGSGAVVKRVARRLKKHFLVGKKDLRTRRLYVSRQKASSRRVVNENELKPLLKERGFDWLVLEDVPWLEQMQLFSAAEAVMGPHGAGLMNMMFALENATIREISAQSKTVPCYLVLARQMAFQFQRLYAQPAGVEAKADMNLLPENM